MLAFGAVIVAAAAVILYLALNTDDSTAGSRPVSEAPEPAPTPAPTPERPGPPVVADSGSDAAPADEDKPREYMVDGVLIRDHRKNKGSGAVDLPRNIHRPNTRQIASTLTHDISGKLQGLMAECVATVPREARGEKPRLEGTVFMTIKDHQVRITEATVQLRNVEGESVAAAKQCMEQRSVGITVPAPDEADLERYSISINYALP